MSTLARTNSHSKKPQYKDYVSFLGSYRNEKKDDSNGIVPSDSGVNFSLNSSANNSSNSVFSDVSDHSSKIGVGSTKPKQVVKSEMFIQIKSPAMEQTYPTQVFKVEVVDKAQQPEQKISVGQTAKIFEKNDQVDSVGDKVAANGLKVKQSSFRQNSIGQLSKKFENSDGQNQPVGKRYVKRATSIGEVSKIFENGISCDERNRTLHRPKNFNAVPKPFQIDAAPSKAKISIKPAISPKPVLAPPAFPKFVPEPPRSYTDSVDSALSSLSISPSPSQCASPPPGGLLLPPPPPPPLPPSSFSFKPVSAQKVVSNNSTTLIKPVTVPHTNGHANTNGTLDKNDPRVKKAVYGALRNMYGAYHDQANDYLATLPKNRVRKNNGLDSIIASIA